MEPHTTNIVPGELDGQLEKPNILYYVVGFFDDKTPYIQYINRQGKTSPLERCAQFNTPTNAIRLASYLSTWKGGDDKTYKVFQVYTDGKIKQLNERDEKDGDYKIMINPWNKMWYVAMKVRKNKWVPVGPGHSDKNKAEKYMKSKYGKLENIKLRMVEMPHISGQGITVDLKIERYPMPINQKKELIKQLNTDEGISAFSKKLGRELRFKKTGITTSSNKEYDKPSRIQLPHYWEKYAIWSR